MSKIYDKYLRLKENNPEKLYLFRCGNFYIFLDEDAELINRYIVLKKTKFTNEVLKCGFPVNSKEEYLKVFQNQNLQVEIIDHPLEPEELSAREKNVVDLLKKMELESISPFDALNKLKELQEMCHE